MINTLKRKNGYTLTYTIIIIGLLLILTASIIMITYLNFKVSRIGGEVNTSFYANDGAIEEALTELSMFTYNAEVKAWENINRQDYLLDTLWIEFTSQIYDDINNDILTIDQGNEIMSSALKGIYETSFYNALLTSDSGLPTTHIYYNDLGIGIGKYPDYFGYTGVSFNGNIELQSSIMTTLNTTIFNPTHIIEPTVEGSNPNPADIDTITISDPVVTNEVTLTISSDGTYHTRNKKISVDVTILPPVYNFTVSTKTESINLRKNDITDYALVAKGNIEFQEGSASIDGPIYAYGHSIDFKYDQPRNNYGGVIIGSGGNPVTVDVLGHIASRNSVKMNSSSSVLNVSDSIYANSLYVSSSASDVNVSANKNIYLYSDLFIGGDRANVTIEQTNPDYGLTGGGADLRLGQAINEYMPSSGNLFGLLSLHPLAGEGYTRTGSIIVSETAEAPSITLNGLFLNGLIRYDLMNENRFKTVGEEEAYKTGESFTTYKNKEYYQTLSTSSIYQSGVISYLENYILNTAAANVSDPDNLVPMVSFNAALDINLNQSTFRAIHFFTTGYYAWLERNSGSEPYTNKDISAVDKSIIKVRNPLRQGQEFYGINALGLIQFKDASSPDLDGKIYHPDLINLNAMDFNKAIIFREMDSVANLLGYADYTQLGSGIYSEKDVLHGELLGSNYVNGWLNYNGVNDVDHPLPENTSVNIYNSDPNRDIYINFDTLQSGEINVRGQINAANEYFDGTIVTEGDVYIYSANRMTFTGNIISNKNIYLVGSGIKEIVQDELTIYSAINKKEDLRKLYYTDSGRQMSISGGMFNNNLVMTPTGSLDVVDINFVNDSKTGGTTIIDSKSLRINKWTEID